MSLLPEIFKVSATNGNEKWSEKWSTVEVFITEALKIYFTKLGYNPFGEAGK